MGRPIRKDARQAGCFEAGAASWMAAGSLLLAAAACRSVWSAPVGSSPPRAPERIPAASEDGSTGASAPGSFSGTAPLLGPLTRATQRFTSRGHGERFDAVVWVNATALAAMNDQRDWPDGAVLVEQTAVARPGVEGADAGDRSTGVLAMEKHGDGWQFLAVKPDGAIVRDARITPCTDCHREAADFVFPLPR